jgi:ribosomal subunit interface protein
MKLPLQVVFRDLPKSDAIEAAIRKHADKLDEFSNHIMSCRVTVQQAARHKHQGKLYSVHVDVKLPNKEIASNRGHEHEDVYVAMRDAFDAVKRQLEDHVRAERGQTKLHEPSVQGRVVRLFEEGHGFIEDTDGNEYYFDRASVVYPSFEKLEVGAVVEFLGELAGQGRQAKHVSARLRHAP